MMPARLAHPDRQADETHSVTITRTDANGYPTDSSNSERRHYRDKSTGTSRDSINKDSIILKRTTSSVDSGAGAEDEESGSRTASEDTEVTDKHRRHFIRHISDTGSDRPSSSSLRRKASGKRSKSQTGTRHHAATSDSAVSTSVLSTSGLSTPTESRIFSSPNLSDHSKTSISPKHSGKTPASSHYPPLTKALRKKQERLKRELDLKETRYQIERQRFMADTYRIHRVGGSLKRRDSSKGGNNSGTSNNHHRTLQKSFSVDSSATTSGRMTESPYASSTPSRKSEGRKYSKEYRSKSVSREEAEKQTSQDGRSGSVSPRNKRVGSMVGHSSDNEGGNSYPNKNKNGGGEPPTTPAVDAGRESDNDLDNVNNNDNDNNNDNNNNRYTEKKQRRKSRKDRSSSSRRRRHDSQENVADAVGKVSNTTEDNNNKMSTDSDDPFEHMARKLNVDTDKVSNEDFSTRMNQAVDSILRDGMPDIPSTEQITETGLLDWRAVFRVEMMRLRREVNEFRVYCQNQVEYQASCVGKSGKPHFDKAPETERKEDGPPSQPDSKPAPPPIVASQLKDLQDNMKLFQKKQELLDLETELLAQEERLAEKQNHLEEYEKEILEVESMLNHRQAICDRRQKTLLNLDEELQSLRTELEETREQMHVEGSIPESNSERARKNWDMLRRNLMDEQKLLETTVQKYRSELASATSTIAGKDILISRLQSVAMQHEEDIAARDRRIRQLESKLTIALSETKTLLDQLPSVSQQHLNASKTALADSSADVLSSSQRTHASSDASPSPGNNEHQRQTFFRSSGSYYRRPSSNANSDQGGDDYTRHRVGSGVGSGGAGGGGSGSAGAGTDGNGGGGGGGHMNGDTSAAPRNNFRTSMSARKRNSVSDNAISRLTLSTPRTEGTSSACVVQ